MPSLLVLTQTHNNWGGIEAWMSEVLPFVEQSGWTVEYGLALGRRFNQPDSFLAHHTYMRRVHTIDGRAATPAARRRGVGKLLARVRPDVVMPLAMGDAFPALREQRSRGLRTKIVVPVHSLHTGTLADVAENKHLIDMVAVVSGLLSRWAIRRFDPSASRVRWIRNGVPAPAVAHDAVQAPALRVGYVGRLDNLIKRAADVSEIIRAVCDRGTPLSLAVVGDGPARGEVEARLASAGALAQIHLHGYQSRSFLYERIYPHLDCLLLTSASEGSPLAVIEAMQHGVVPIISEFFGHAAEGLLRPGHNCLSFPVADIEVASRQLQRLAADRALLGRLSQQARASVQTLYERTSMQQGWVGALEDVLSLPGRTAIADQPEVAYGRLDRWGVPSPLANSIRRFLPQQSCAATGFDEWPGSICTDSAAVAAIADELRALEAACVTRAPVERHAHC
jgi:glycosyltransferase involved in cell wall biosynthesis